MAERIPTPREIRRAFGPAVAGMVQAHQARIAAHGAILRRGFFGRLKWLLFGR